MDGGEVGEKEAFIKTKRTKQHSSTAATRTAAATTNPAVMSSFLASMDIDEEQHIPKSFSTSDFTDLTFTSVSSNSSLTEEDELSSHDNDESCQLDDEQLNSQDEPQQRKVRFSMVKVREYNVVDELPSPQDDEDVAPRRSLGWEFTESQSDIESHIIEVAKQRKENYVRLIHDHIIRAESRHETEKKQPKKKNGFGSRIRKTLKPIGQGLMEAAARTNFGLPSPY